MEVVRELRRKQDELKADRQAQIDQIAKIDGDTLLHFGQRRTVRRTSFAGAQANRRHIGKAGSREGRAEMRARRSRWIKIARAEFEEWERGERQPCAVCKKYITFVHAHHSFPLSLQFECGVEHPIHDHQWLCPIHHKYVHVLLNGHLLGSNDLSFLDCIPDSEAEEWIAIEQVAEAGIDLCCEALERVPSDTKKRRYDPEYSLYLLRNPSLAWPAIEWKRSLRTLRGIAA